MPKKEKPPPDPTKKKRLPDPNLRYWFKDHVCGWFRMSPECLRRWIRDRSFPPPLHDATAGYWTDRKGNRIPCDKGRWLVSDVLKWEAENLTPREPVNDNVSPDERREELKIVED